MLARCSTADRQNIQTDLFEENKMRFTDMPDPSTPWWLWFVVFWGALIILWMCFGRAKVSRKQKRQPK
jgi:hypothetical protein